jgi:hypothetical protein
MRNLLHTSFVGNQPIIIYIRFSNALKPFSVQVNDRHFGAINIDLNRSTPNPYPLKNV